MSREEIKKLKTTIYEKVERLNNETALQMVEEAVMAYSSPSQKDILDELTTFVITTAILLLLHILSIDGFYPRNTVFCCCRFSCPGH